MAVHAAWNFTQSNLFGLPNSGNLSEFSVFKFDIASAKSSIFYNTVFGIEAAWTAAAVFAAISALIVLYGKKKGIKPLDVWKNQAA